MAKNLGTQSAEAETESGCENTRMESMDVNNTTVDEVKLSCESNEMKEDDEKSKEVKKNQNGNNEADEMELVEEKRKPESSDEW